MKRHKLVTGHMLHDSLPMKYQLSSLSRWKVRL